MDPDLDISEIKKKYRRLSILVHPDKNRDDTERAQAAFDALKKAYELLEVNDYFTNIHTTLQSKMNAKLSKQRF